MPAPKPARIDDDSICNCKPSAEGNCGSNECMNRMLHIECNPRSCPCGESCKNQRIRKREHAPLQIVKTESKGNGAICTVDLNPGDLVTEYCGEIIDEKTRDERLLEMEKVGDTRYYFFSIDGQTIIDAGRKGSLARFLNHSCDPNCITEKWDVNGVTRVGIFAKQKIKAGEELTYDYNFLGFWKDGKEHRCNCGSNNCSGLFGKRPLKLSTSSSSGSSDSKKPSSQNSKKSKKQKKKDDLHLPQKISNVKNFSTWIEHLLANEVDPYAQIAESHNIYLTRNRQSGYRSIVDKIRTTQSQSQ
jgi:histone-lysine N-methyltransferase NSD2